MENRLKERLTGAAILVALIVALVPELFRGQSDVPAGNAGSAASGNAASSGGDGAPLRSYTIDLSNNPGTQPLQSSSEPEPAAATAVPAAPLASPAPAAPAVSAATPSTPSQSPSAPRYTPAAPAPASAHTARGPAAPNSSTPAAPGTPRAAPAANWSVQLGLFSKRENAERMVSAAKAKGFNAGISNPDAKGQFHVHVTGLTDRNAALAMAQKLKGEGLPAAVVAP